MKKTIPLKIVSCAMTLTAFCAVLPLVAQDAEEPAAEEGGESKGSGESVGSDAVAQAAGALDEMTARANAAAEKAQKHFHQLLRVDRMTRCSVDVREPRGDWKPATERKFYPYGSTFRVKPGAEGRPLAVFVLGAVARIVATNEVEFATREIEIGEKNRVVMPVSGAFKLVLPRNLPKGVFQVAAPNWTCRDLAGDSYFDYRVLPDGDETHVRVITGEMALSGAHYEVPRMSPADRLVVRTTSDKLFTSLRGESGIFSVKLDQGIVRKKDFATGETTDEAKTLDYRMSPRCTVKIWRKLAKVGGRAAVSILTMNAEGEIRNRCAFVVGRYNVNSGELVVDQKAAKAAADAAKANAELLSGQATTEEGGDEAASEEEGEGEEKKEEEETAEEIDEY